MINHKRALSILLSVGMCTTVLCGCSAESLAGIIEEYAPEVVAGQTVSDDSKWINSAIDGSIDEATAVRAQDDFYTYVNKDWQLSQTLTDEVPSISFSTDATEMITDRIMGLMFGEDDPEALTDNALPTLSVEQTEHNRKLVQNLTALAADYEGREEAGVEPIRPYLEAIDSISSMDELTSYLKNEDGTNYTLIFPVPMSVGTSLQDADEYTVILSNAPSLVMVESDEYKAISYDAINTKELLINNYLIC